MRWSPLNWLVNELLVLGRELRAFRAIFHVTGHNATSKSVGTIILLLVWSSVYVGTTFGLVAQRPPLFLEFTIIVFVILGRWWGVELVYHSIGEIVGDIVVEQQLRQQQDSDDERDGED